MPENSTKRQKYEALVGLCYPTDPEIIARLQAGEDIPFEQRGLKEVAPGEVVDDIPECSIAWLVEQSQIRPVGQKAK